MNSPNVLCIDSRSLILKLRKALLESHGFVVETASSGYAAIQILEKAPVEAILLEYNPEGMDVEAVALHIKQRFPQLPIILLSAHFEMSERILWLVDEYLMKSELPDGLLAILQRVSHARRRKMYQLALPAYTQAAAA